MEKLTVGEMIDQLSKFNRDTKVVFVGSINFGDYVSTSVDMIPTIELQEEGFNYNTDDCEDSIDGPVVRIAVSGWITSND